MHINRAVAYKRRTGATLTFVALCAVIIIALGICFVLLMKIFGGGRELANAGDAGTLNVAKQALKQPSKDALTFANNDIRTNFAVYGDPGSIISLLNYNRLVSHAAIVALNAQTEGSRPAAQNARRVWTALNEVASYLRRELEDINYANVHFDAIAGANNAKMLGNNRISVNDYQIGFMKRGGSTNVPVNPDFLKAAKGGSLIPLNESGQKSPDGYAYFAGYKPFSVNLTATGEVLTFCGVTVCPNDRPHLIRLGDFESETSDDFIAGNGVPSYPAEAVPPNSFRVSFKSKESTSNAVAGAVAAAIVGCHDKAYPMQMDFGYLEIKNGPRLQKPQGRLSLEGDDVFCHALASNGIAITGTNPNRDYFSKANRVRDAKEVNASGNNEQQVRDELQDMNAEVEFRSLIDEWVAYNNGHINNHPNINKSLEEIFHANGDRVRESDLFALKEKTYLVCRWPDFDDNSPPRYDACKQLIDAFKHAYRQRGSFDRNPNIQDNGFTALECFKCEVISSRDGCKGCRRVDAPNVKSGMKWFDHQLKYPAPGNDGKHPYNFGTVKSPYEYLEMIDQVEAANGCGKTSVLEKLLERSRQIMPSATNDDIVALLKSKPLPLDTTLYLFKENGRLVMQTRPPAWYVPNTEADGDSARIACGAAYDVIGKFVNTSSEPPMGPIVNPDHGRIDPETDGLFPGWNYRNAPKSECTDQAVWVPSTGFNQLLGVLEFNNSCSGGGRFCQPN